MRDRLSDHTIKNVLEIDPSNSDTLLKSEDDTIEYKKSFSFDNQLMKTCAAFANCNGGYIVFGIEDQERIIKGLDDAKAKKFNEYDLAKATERLNSKFTPTIRIQKKLFSVGNRSLGIIYVYESDSKPVIATSSGQDVIREGDIYYSYGARRERIKYANLRSLLDEVLQNKVAELFKHVELIANIGVENAAVMDTVSGKVTGPAIKSFIISEELVDKLKFVKEGKFSETSGDPTFMLSGTLHTSNNDPTNMVPRHISEHDIFFEFLGQQSIETPREYIKACCDLQTPYSPIYYYARQANMTLSELRDYVGEIPNAREHTKTKLLARISDDNKLSETLIDTGTLAYKHRSKYRNNLVEGVEISVENNLARYLIFAIRTLSKREISRDQLFALLNELYEQRRELKSGDKSNLRKGICSVDHALYGYHE